MVDGTPADVEATLYVGLPELTAPSAYDAQVLARETGKDVEDLSQRTSTQAVVALPDGSWRTHVHGAPQWVLTSGDGTSDADWSPLDSTLVVRADGFIVPVAHTEGFVIAPGGERTDLILETTDSESGETVSLLWDGSYLPPAQIDGARVTYPEVKPGIDYVIELSPVGYEQFYVAKNRGALRAAGDLFLDFSVDGGEITSDGAGGATFLDRNENTIAFVPVAVAWDAETDVSRGNPVLKPWRGDPRRPFGGDREMPAGQGSWRIGFDADVEFQEEAVEVEVEPREGGARLKLNLPAGWADDPSTRFPVVIDPYVVLYPTYDTYYQTNSSVNHQSYSYLLMGTPNSGSVKYRTYLNVTTTPIQGLTVTAAHFNIWNYHSWSCSARSWRAYAGTNVTSQVSWPGPGYDGGVYGESSATLGYSSSCNDGWVSTDITAPAQMWSEDLADSYHSLALVAGSETNNYYWKRFYSLSASSHHPHLVVYYNQPPDVPSGVLVNGFSLDSSALTLTDPYPVLEATVSDLDGGMVRAVFDIYDGVDLLGSFDGSLVASGGTSMIVFATPLDPDVAYTVKVRASDTLDESAVLTVPNTLTYVVAAPDLPSAGLVDVPAYCDDDIGAVVAPSPAPCTGAPGV